MSGCAPGRCERHMQQQGLPRAVVALGFVSLCMDTSSELIHSLLPLFLVGTLGASPLLLGLIEGVAEATASFMRLFSGAISDHTGRRKPLLLFGYGLAALSKPLFPLAGSVLTVMGARVVDRIGKGIRGAPRDALIADVTPAAQRGAAFGLRQSMDTVGAFLGPMLAMALMFLLAGDIRNVMWAATVPALVAVLLILRYVDEPATAVPAVGARASWRVRELVRMPRIFWIAVVLGMLLTLARFSEAFLLLRASELGLAAALVPLILIAMNLAYAMSAWPAGVVSDRLGRKPLLGLGIALLILADLLLAIAHDPWLVALGAIVWGLHLGATQGLLAALVADTAPVELRGSAFGVLHFAAGIAMLAASLVAGFLWSWLGAEATFGAGAVFALCAVTVLGVLPPTAAVPS
ncbi:MAG: MFS transporter [Pseudomonadales bacterium]|nr:MFS transporter [Pseudomonadales bacterium]